LKGKANFVFFWRQICENFLTKLFIFGFLSWLLENPQRIRILLRFLQLSTDIMILNYIQLYSKGNLLLNKSLRRLMEEVQMLRFWVLRFRMHFLLNRVQRLIFLPAILTVVFWQHRVQIPLRNSRRAVVFNLVSCVTAFLRFVWSQLLYFLSLYKIPTSSRVKLILLRFYEYHRGLWNNLKLCKSINLHIILYKLIKPRGAACSVFIFVVVSNVCHTLIEAYESF